MILFGASGHCKVVLDILLLSNIQVEAIYDDAPKTDNIFGIPVLKNELDLTSKYEAIISIGNNEIRRDISKKFPGFSYKKAIHPNATVSDFSKIGDGTVIMAGSLVNPDAVIGRHCIINTGAVIEHDCIVEDFAHISPNASIAGNVTVGEGTHIGIGSTLIQGVTVGKWCVVGAGAVIIKDIPDFSVVVGNPGRIIKQNIIKI